MNNATAPDEHPLFMFLASTAHDMKNSISVLSGTLEGLLAESTPESQPSYNKMAHMLYQTMRLNDNLMQLLALYKQVGQPAYPIDIQPVEVSSLLEQVVWADRVLLHSKNIELDLDFDPELIWHLDEDLIIGVLGHAINNAIRYTRSRIRLAAHVVDGMLEFRVEDNGTGYPASILVASLSALRGGATMNFMTNSTGLGLYFSGEVARMHKHRHRTGHVRLENGGKLGGGCFILSLP